MKVRVLCQVTWQRQGGVCYSDMKLDCGVFSLGWSVSPAWFLVQNKFITLFPQSLEFRCWYRFFFIMKITQTNNFRHGRVVQYAWAIAPVQEEEIDKVGAWVGIGMGIEDCLIPVFCDFVERCVWTCGHRRLYAHISVCLIVSSSVSTSLSSLNNYVHNHDKCKSLSVYKPR